MNTSNASVRQIPRESCDDYENVMSQANSQVFFFSKVSRAHKLFKWVVMMMPTTITQTFHFYYLIKLSWKKTAFFPAYF